MMIPVGQSAYVKISDHFSGMPFSRSHKIECRSGNKKVLGVVPHQHGSFLLTGLSQGRTHLFVTINGLATGTPYMVHVIPRSTPPEVILHFPKPIKPAEKVARAKRRAAVASRKAQEDAGTNFHDAQQKRIGRERIS